MQLSTCVMHASVMWSGGVPNGNNTLWSSRKFLEPNAGDVLYGNNHLYPYVQVILVRVVSNAKLHPILSVECQDFEGIRI